MKQNGMRTLAFHIPLLVRGTLTYFRGMRDEDQAAALRFLSQISNATNKGAN